MTRYKPVRDGELVQPVMEGYRLRCCDCGLVHRIDFQIDGEHVQLRAYRDNRATAQVRRHAQRET